MTTPPNKTTTGTYWMIAVFKFGRWECDHGRFVDREDCEEDQTEDNDFMYKFTDEKEFFLYSSKNSFLETLRRQHLIFQSLEQSNPTQQKILNQF